MGTLFTDPNNKGGGWGCNCPFMGLAVKHAAESVVTTISVKMTIQADEFTDNLCQLHYQ